MQHPKRNMLRFKVAIICSVIVSLIFVHGTIASQQRDATTMNQERELLKQLIYDQFDRQHRLLASRSGHNRFSPLERDDFDSNIDLNRVNDPFSYYMLDGSPNHDNQPSNSNNNNNNKNNNNGEVKSRSSLSQAGTRTGRMFNNINKNRYYSEQQDGQYYKGKRVLFPVLSPMKEDKDYSFVGIPQQETQQASYQIQPTSNQQDFASKASVMAAEVLRDVLADTKAKNRLRNLNQLSSSTYFRPPKDGPDPNELINLDDIVSSQNREKRRRCKMDPNLGVKNPSFCDTDAYFGAADYGTRDVWESAGR